MIAIFIYNGVAPGSFTSARTCSLVTTGRFSGCIATHSSWSLLIKSEVRCITTYLSVIDDTSWIIEGVHGFTGHSGLHAFRSFTRWLEEVLM